MFPAVMRTLHIVNDFGLGLTPRFDQIIIVIRRSSNCLAKYCTDWLCSNYQWWCHNNKGIL